MTKNLDAKDWRILELLCKNARLSHNQIATNIGLSKNAVTYRIGRLKEKGIITGFFTIINHDLIGLRFYEILLKTNAGKEEWQLIEFLKNHSNILVVDRLSGEWNLIIEFGCKNISSLYTFINDLKDRFSKVVQYYEVHCILDILKVEQLPVELIKEKRKEKCHDAMHIHLQNARASNQEINKIMNVDNIDKILLFELNKDCTVPLHVLADKLKLTSETISARIKRLKEKKIILKFTARISLTNLGYDLYLMILDLQNLSKERENSLRMHILDNPNIRYSFFSASQPKIFIYFAAKNSDALDSFLIQSKELFPDIIFNQKYLIVRGSYKYELFPAGLV